MDNEKDYSELHRLLAKYIYNLNAILYEDNLSNNFKNYLRIQLESATNIIGDCYISNKEDKK